MNSLRSLITLLLFLTIAQIRGASPLHTAVFHPGIKSLQAIVDGDPGLPPVLALNGDSYLTVSFDELADESSFLRYSIEHCNADWMPSGLVESEYLDGFNFADISDYRFSGATTVSYVHYSFTIPNEQIRPTLSGNYILKVYRDNEPDTPLLQLRFSISEQSAIVRASIDTRTDIDINERHQQLSVDVDTRGEVANIYNDLIVKISQNGRTDNEVRLTTPLSVSGNTASYRHLPALIFPAGNEYRRFEIVSTEQPTMQVSDISYIHPYYHATLYDDTPRRQVPYNYDLALGGRYVVRQQGSADSDVDADYLLTHFTLDMPELLGYDIYLDGDMTLRAITPDALMHYDLSEGKYTTTLLLKQGSYSYQYIAVPKGSSTGYTAPVEGDFYRTANQYTISVYYRKPGSRYDRLLGTTTISAAQ